MAGADETPNDRAGCYRPNTVLSQNIESPSLLIGDAFAPVRYARNLLSFYRKTPPPSRALGGGSRGHGERLPLRSLVVSHHILLVHLSHLLPIVTLFCIVLY